MKTAPAALGAAVWFVLAPGVVSGLIPWWLTRWQARELGPWWVPLQVIGGVLIVGGAAVLVHAFARFVSEGRGTPVPVAPPERLVVGGLYRYVRNPMYVAVVAVILGQALLHARWELLSRRFGAEYAEYRAGVRRWWPRLRPWRPS